MKNVLAFLMVLHFVRLVPGAPPLEEGFEATAFPPPGWTTKTAGLPVPHAWHRTTDPDYRGTGRASAYVGSQSPSAIDEWLITPAVVLSATDKTLKFSWSGSSYWSRALDASVNIRKAGGTDWTPLWSIAGNESSADPFNYRQCFVDLSAWTGMKVEFGFRVVGTNGASFGLDDVAIGDFAPAGEFLLPEDTTCATAPNRSASPWRVVAVRSPWAEDVPFETRTGYVPSSGNRNYVFGPDSLVARVAIEKRRGYVEVVDLRTGNVRRLPDAWGSLPQWSPDGRYISCVVWKSTRRPYELTVVDVATMTVAVKPELRISGTETKWSPDSHMIAASGVLRDSPRSMLCVISIPGVRITVIDTVEVDAPHEFSWSPDGRWIAFSRPTRADGHYGTTAAALWIADAMTGESWCILDATEWAEMDPLWVTNRSIQVTRVRWGDEGDNEEQRVVVELSHTADLRH